MSATEMALVAPEVEVVAKASRRRFTVEYKQKKGQGNTKNGNKYLAWAFVEAAHFAIRFNAKIKRFYQRKKAKTKIVVAIKAVAHKLCRACYYIMRDRVAFDVTKAFGQQ